MFLLNCDVHSYTVEFRKLKPWGLSVEGNSRFKIDWPSLIVGTKLTVFALFYFAFEGSFPSTSPQGAYLWRGDLTEGFLHFRLRGHMLGRAYFRNFTVTLEVRITSVCLTAGH